MLYGVRRLIVVAAVVTLFAAAPFATGQSARADSVTAMVDPIANLAPGQAVTLLGTVDRITDDDEFLLRDATGAVPVYVGPNPIPAAVGDRVTVIGVVDDDGPIEIYATTIVLADGTEVALSNRY
ncbi:NirD/YgiW/YdeI family stress tolerance protein [Roseobacter sp. HKCCD9010]|nr:NirD/YgiW/YdeI family stress tolerance protein [Rhodobacterales bacterium HKCCD4356]NNV12854.1 NirD/YgiW/YdeI family stress tolerance protein [Roseobacter sp. HKCCD7357]NNV16799.1 NirD/YgiW/YdeI family stress tolerance protein [Roseobacter sp. HKCCD8768]NNV26569.1 NirD/YgiW/YdeI family stress tolerance protein [Roseobacter sp. HKCCD8192]NNV30520.1 NirD/YgiW/YdeI family stress tolerance protein [Roseobacter sp. HKCCD9061]NNV34645.1 NirD/YgiW/YdeI family stress tolerance protein [Roseobacter 